MDETDEHSPLINHCPECGEALDVSAVPPFAKIECAHCSTHIRVRTTMGQYEIMGVVGEGGMSQVFRAMDRNLGREVALKVLHQALTNDPALTLMFEREAKLTAAIVHPNVVKVFSVGSENGYFYIAMELLRAASMEQLIMNRHALSEDEVLSIALDVAKGLQAAQEEGLMHRDIKPGNILVTESGTAKIVDFGLALQQGGEDLAEDLWATPFYVPPEKLDGAPDTFVGDIYSLGATLYHALAGRPPFDANTSSLDELREIKHQAIHLKSAAPGLSAKTIALVERMMAYRPEDRLGSYEELIDAIHQARRAQSGSTAKATETRKRQHSGSGAGWIVGGLILLAMAVVAVLFLQHTGPADEEPLGVEAGERVISIGESGAIEQYKAAREKFASGSFNEAATAFTTLSDNAALPGSTRIWSLFFLGTIQLFSGDVTHANSAFQRIAALTAEPGADPDLVVFLQKTARLLGDPLPALTEDVQFKEDSYEALGFLATGLKNWQGSEFVSGEALLRSFLESHPPEQYPWMEQMKTLVNPFLEDYAILSAAPNPAASLLPAQLAEMKTSLEGAIPKIKTAGAARALLQKRMDRIGEIQKLAQEPSLILSSTAATNGPESTNVDAMDQKSSQDSIVEANPAMASPTGDASVESSPANPESEVQGLREQMRSLTSVTESLKFAEVSARLKSEDCKTEAGVAMRDALVQLSDRGTEYLRDLARRLQSAPLTNVDIRRREGEAITGGLSASAGMEDGMGFDKASLLVDVGFGQSPIPVADLAVDWLLEIGKPIQAPTDSESAGKWANWICFGILTGQRPAVEEQANQLAKSSPDFATQWNLLGQLSGG